jgi:tetratricopeptide (TPR) repeat protein
VRNRRLFATLLAIAAPVVSATAASYSEVRERIHPGEVRLQDIQLEDILAAPAAHQNMRVRFRCIFVENGVLFDTQHTHFTQHNFVNMIVYDDHAAVWDPQVRAQPVTTLFIAKDRVDASVVATLRKYQLVDLIGEVTTVLDGQPMITVHAIKPVTEVGALSDTSVYHIQEANKLSSENGYALAEDHYAAAMAEHIPDADRVMVGHLRGRNQMNWGQYEACAKTMRAAISLAVYDGSIDRRSLAAMHYLLAKAIAETGEQASTAESRAARYQEAITHARKSVELDPEQGDAYAVLGITLAGLGQYDEARRKCENAIILRPNNAEVRWYLGRILDQRGDYEEAIEALRKAIDLTPKDHRIHKAIGAVYLHRAEKGGPKAGDDFITALREYEIAIRLTPADPEAHFGAGVVIDAAAKAKAEVMVGAARQPATPAMAMERFKAAVAADGRYLPVRRVLADRYRAANQPDELVAQLKAICEVEPEREDNFFELGRTLWSLGRKPDAVAAYEKCAELHPTSLSALYQLAQVALEAGDQVKGNAAADRLLKMNPEHGPGNLVKARLLIADGKAKEAIPFARTAHDALTDPAAKEEARQVVQQAEGEASRTK